MLSKLAFKFMSHTRSLYTKSDRILVVHDDNLLYAHLLAEKLKSGTNITVANPSRVKDEDDGEDEAAAKGKCKGKGKGKGEGKGKGKAEGDAEAEAAKNSVKNKDKGESGIDRESFQQAGGGHRCKRLKLLGAQVFFGTNFSNLIEKITEKDFDKIVYVNRHKLNAE
ncbi:hypothetical protein HanXRQr2_Chr09g0397161 [Helianthus annuus]|uniref:Uncharacterized protein n=1 Tax=Helianthus annuus TaxID=4232 RepID=A0A9K3N8Y2_HELAN|nr:hypothetical protein HanXRQr2_Chr09g0397161 [Helianthus annuus]KAJ0893893.1 hypothetical protein HanPSC8_Chr09g0382921 [Helianthus annuus]